ncbi:MAG: anion permease, partial [Oscillospiraceae bacterium]|nr:anion permease [Oscillospiraceae bacterium]
MALILILCVAAFIWDRFPAASVSVAACIAMVVCGVCSPSEMMAGFTNDIVLIVFGTEIFGIAFQESGLSAKTSELIVRLSGRNERSVIIIAGLTAALLSAFLNNQVICALMMIICIHIAGSAPKIAVKNITLPVIYCAVMGGQCTLVGAPATLIASS